MAKYASKVLEQAKAWLGYNENDGTHKQIIDVYNAHTPRARGYKVKYTDEWCATFVSAVSIKLGYTDIMPTECSCYYMVELYKKLGCWVENENRTPNPGDILFYNWSDNGVGDNKGTPNHVGIVEKVSGGKVTIIEGNYKKGVNRRVLSVNAKYMRGYAVPKYDAESNNKPNNENDQKGTVEVKVSVLKKGAKGEQVKALQVLLIGYGYKMENNGKTYGVDGSFGTATDNAVRAYQKANGLAVDGSVGSATWNKLLGN